MKKSIPLLVALVSAVSPAKVDAVKNIRIRNSNFGKKIRNDLDNNRRFRKRLHRKGFGNSASIGSKYSYDKNVILRAKKIVANNPGGKWQVRKINGKEVAIYVVSGVTLISVPLIYLLARPTTKGKIGKQFDSLIIPGITDFFENYDSMSKFLKTKFPKAVNILKKQPALTTLDAKSDVMIIGDVHGTTEVLKELIPKISDFLNENNTNSVVILGDFIDRHTEGSDASIYAVFYFSYLLKKFPGRLRILKGNHEDVVHGHMGSLGPEGSDWWCDSLQEFMYELPIACIIFHNGKKYFAVHGGIDDRLEINNNNNSNLKKRLLKNKELTRDKDIIDTLESRLMWNDFWDSYEGYTNDKRRNRCSEEKTSKFLEKHGFSAIFRGHNPFEKPVLRTEKGKHVVTVHSNSVIGKHKRHELNARIAYIKDNDIKLDYFLDDKVIDIKDWDKS